jgi:exodeoxyribonuclease X
MKMPFGKHKGTPLDELPLDYMTWILENLSDMRDDLREELQNQVLLKQGKGIVRKEVKREGTKFTFK